MESPPCSSAPLEGRGTGGGATPEPARTALARPIATSRTRAHDDGENEAASWLPSGWCPQVPAAPPTPIKCLRLPAEARTLRLYLFDVSCYICSTKVAINNQLDRLCNSL